MAIFKASMFSILHNVFRYKFDSPQSPASTSISSPRSAASSDVFSSAVFSTIVTIGSPGYRASEHFDDVADASHDPNVLDIMRAAPTGANHHNVTQLISSYPKVLSVFKNQASPAIATATTLSSSISLVTPPSTSINPADFTPLSVVGAGATGKVYLVTHMPTGISYALKVIRRRTGTCERVLQEQMALRRIAEQDRYLYLLGLEASCCDEKNFYLATRYHPQNLQSELARFTKLTPACARLYAAEIVLALEGLHKLGIIHRDLKLANILLDAAGHIVLADFGMARLFAPFPQRSSYQADAPPFRQPVEDETLRARLYHPYVGAGVPVDLTDSKYGTLAYAAPEVRAGLPYSYGVDFWSLGVVVYLMLMGKFPFGSLGEEAMPPFEPGEMDGEAEEFLARLLNVIPSSRPNLDDIKADPFFSTIDWDALARREVISPYIPYPSQPTPQQNLRISLGKPYEPDTHPYPHFAYTSPAFSLACKEKQGACASEITLIPASNNIPSRVKHRLRMVLSLISGVFTKRDEPEGRDAEKFPGQGAARLSCEEGGGLPLFARFRAWFYSW